MKSPLVVEISPFKTNFYLVKKGKAEFSKDFRVKDRDRTFRYPRDSLYYAEKFKRYFKYNLYIGGLQPLIVVLYGKFIPLLKLRLSILVKALVDPQVFMYELDEFILSQKLKLLSQKYTVKTYLLGDVVYFSYWNGGIYKCIKMTPSIDFALKDEIALYLSLFDFSKKISNINIIQDKNNLNIEADAKAVDALLAIFGDLFPLAKIETQYISFIDVLLKPFSVLNDH